MNECMAFICIDWRFAFDFWFVTQEGMEVVDGTESMKWTNNMKGIEIYFMTLDTFR
jgi:hypothetical protein